MRRRGFDRFKAQYFIKAKKYKNIVASESGRLKSFFVTMSEESGEKQEAKDLMSVSE
jgi:hypothetical protein